MSKSKTFFLDQINIGYNIAWVVTTQYSKQVSVELFDGDRKILSASKKIQTNEFQTIGQSENLYMVLGQLKLVITVDTTYDLQDSHISGAVTDSNARKVGYAYDFCIDAGTDNDFNDVYINIVGWARKG